MSTDVTVTQGSTTLFRYTAEIRPQSSDAAAAVGAVQADAAGNPYTMSLNILADIQSRVGDYMNDAIAAYNSSSGGSNAAGQQVVRRSRTTEGGADDESDESDS